MRAYKDMSRKPLRISQRLKENKINTNATNSKRLLKKCIAMSWENFYLLLREYTILNAKIFTEYSSILTHAQQTEELVLRQEFFDLLRQKEVRI